MRKKNIQNETESKNEINFYWMIEFVPHRLVIARCLIVAILIWIFFLTCRFRLAELCLQTPMKCRRANRITMTTEVRRHNRRHHIKNQSIHWTRLIRFCFGKPPSINCQGKYCTFSNTVHSAVHNIILYLYFFLVDRKMGWILGRGLCGRFTFKLNIIWRLAKSWRLV